MPSRTSSSRPRVVSTRSRRPFDWTSWTRISAALGLRPLLRSMVMTGVDGTGRYDRSRLPQHKATGRRLRAGDRAVARAQPMISQLPPAASILARAEAVKAAA